MKFSSFPSPRPNSPPYSPQKESEPGEVRSSFLLYGILKIPSPLPLPEGVSGLPVEIIKGHNLGVALSRVDRSSLSEPSISILLSYEKAVHHFHQKGSFLPFGYGCFLEGQEIQDLLQKNKSLYLTSLERLEGCEEMGLRLLLPSKTEPSSSLPPSSSPGQIYLEHRRLHYQQRDLSLEEQEKLTGQILRDFEGLFLDTRVETTSFHPIFRIPLLSLFFLIKRDRRGDFIQAFQKIERKIGERKIYLSGPWPAYNFVSPFLTAQ